MKASFHRLMLKKGGKRATWEYPFAVAGINISFMLIQMLDLCSGVLTISQCIIIPSTRTLGLAIVSSLID